MLLPVLNVFGHGTPKATMMGLSGDTVLQHCFLLGLGKRGGMKGGVCMLNLMLTTAFDIQC